MDTATAMPPPVESVLWEEADALVGCGGVGAGPSTASAGMGRFTNSARRGLRSILNVFLEDVLLSVGMMVVAVMLNISIGLEKYLDVLKLTRERLLFFGNGFSQQKPQAQETMLRLPIYNVKPTFTRTNIAPI